MERLIPAGALPHFDAKDVAFSRLGVGFEKLDRDVFNPEPAYDPVAAIGVKKIRLQSGWMKTEKDMGLFLADYSKYGATHHSVFVYDATIADIQFFGELIGVETVVI